MLTLNDYILDAMVLWEAFCDSPTEDMKQYREANGTCECRDRVAELVPLFANSWRHAQENGYDDSIDWEYAPWWLRNCVKVQDGSWGIILKLP